MKQLKILLVEDDADDVELLQEALKDNKIDVKLDVIMEGDKVMPHLHALKERPDIIVIDFNLPKIHGKEVLVAIRSSSAFANIPVVVLTTSAAPHDIQFARDNGADRFITKPSTISGFNEAVENIISLAGIRQ